jgi:hypothetical protein
MQRFARWHIWLGWIAAIPLIAWTASGLVMAARPIDEVRGTNLRSEPPALPEDNRFAVPEVDGAAVRKMTLLQRVDGPVWVIERVDGSILASSAASGEQIQGVTPALARRIADAALRAPGPVVEVRRFEADANPIDLRRGRPAWQVRYADGLRVYVDADSGEVLALRTRWWRFYDVMWGLHIMDPAGRENAHNPLVWLFGASALVTSLFGATLLLRRRRATNRA